NITLTSSYTVSAWIKFKQYGAGWGRLYEFGDSPTFMNSSFFVPNDGLFVTFCQVKDGNWSFGSYKNSTTLFPLNTWVHLVYVVDYTNNKETLYINGIEALVHYNANWGSVVSSLGTLAVNDIGHSGWDSAHISDLSCKIDDFRLYSAALSKTQAAALYNNAAQ
ncbi:MAG TPA: LamG-like jellyroll fold domain-containing protein, partial [Bacillota bacterium]|nr:LamG-like jellyroll fold domain-containing protein [Bacillota bacterium]